MNEEPDRNETRKRFLGPVLLLLGLGVYIIAAGTTNFCPACAVVTQSLGIGGGESSAKTTNTSPIPTNPADRPVAPAWTAIDLNGKPLSSDSLRGSVYLIDFWATWCGPCVRMVPDLVELERRYRDQGFTIVGVSLDQDGPEVVRSFNERFQVSYPVVMADAAILQAFGDIDMIPTSFLIDREGRIVSRHVGAVPQSELDTEIRSLIFRNPTKSE